MKMTKSINIIALLIVSFYMTGCITSKKDSVAAIGNKPISLTQVNEQTDILIASNKSLEAVKKNNNQLKQLKVNILNRIIEQELLLQAASQAGYKRSDEYKNMLKNYKKSLLLNMIIRDEIDKKVTVSDDMVKSVYDNNPQQFEIKEISHILVEDEKEANQLLRYIKKGRSFNRLAREKSIDNATKANSGKVGWILPNANYFPEVKKEIFSSEKKGVLDSVVKSQVGYHIVKIHDQKQLDFDDNVKKAIKDALITQQKAQLRTTLINNLKEKITVKTNLDKLN